MGAIFGVPVPGVVPFGNEGSPARGPFLPLKVSATEMPTAVTHERITNRNRYGTTKRNIVPKIGAMRYAMGRVPRKKLKMPVSRPSIYLNKWVSFIISTKLAPIRVTKSATVQRINSASLIKKSVIVAAAMIAKPIARMPRSPYCLSASLPAGNSKRTNGRSIIANMTPISLHSKPMYAFRYSGV